MNFLKLKDNVCRICLEHEGNLNWNDEILRLCGVTYKDCYYKYTKLEEMDPDPYPTNLCNKCAEELQNVHNFVEKAIESVNVLGEYFNTDKCNNSMSVIKNESDAANRDIKNLILAEQTPCLTLCEIETCSKSENSLNELKINEGAAVEPTYFIDIQKLESSVDLEEHFDKLCGSEAPNSLLKRKTSKKMRNVGTKLKAFEHQIIENFDNQSCTAKKARKKKRCSVLPEETLNKTPTEEGSKNNDINSEEIESKVTILEISKSKSSVSAKKSREKYLLMCSYCSLKVEGAKKLEKHEATHNENRERTVICPKCGLKLYTDWSLHLHMKTHDSNRQKNHKCEFCEKAFFNKGALNVHRRIHLGQMIKCQICKKDFFRQVDLDKHLLKHSASPLEKNVGKKKYVANCQYCNKSILTDKLKEHIAVHLDQPQVKCTICDKNFYSRTKCTNHLRRFHLKNLSEYEEFIHYYVDRNKRLSSLMIKQQLVVQPLNK